MNCSNKNGGIASVILFCFLECFTGQNWIKRQEMGEYFEKDDNRIAFTSRFL